MLLQEETLKRADRERCQLVERVDAAERTLAATDNDKRLLEVLRRLLYEILVDHNCVVWFYIHFNYFIVYHVIILYFSVLLLIVFYYVLCI